ncbi:MAG: HAD-IB family hydrolase [Steroidobacteraceae bacterium]
MRSGNLAVFDLDGTITRHDTLWPFLLGYLWRRPWRVPRMLLAVPAALRFAFQGDRGDIKGALIHAALGGLMRPRLERWAELYVARVLCRDLFAEALAAIATHRRQGDRLLLMSASTDLYVPRIGAALGFDETICTKVRWRQDGRLDGHLASANCRGEEKLRCLQALVARERPECVYAYADSGSDLPHLQWVQRGFLINASRATLRRAAAGIQSLHWSQRASAGQIL